MKKLLIILVSFILIVSVGGCHMRDSKSEQEQLIEFARSSEAREVYERTIKNLDPNAFTPEGKIQSYEVDETSVKKNPMGGIDIEIHINELSDMILYINIDKGILGNLENTDGSQSAKLSEFLEDK